jgi:hypothetical protein
MRGNCQGRFLLGCLSALLALPSCKDEPTDVIENVGGGCSAAGNAGESSQAGSSGSAGGGGAPVDAGAGGTSAGAGGSGITPVPGQNVFADPSFESGTNGWSCLGPCVVSLADDDAHTGTASLFVTNRAQDWNGPAYDITDLVAPGATYQIRGWLRRASQNAEDAGPLSQQSLRITVQRKCVTDPAEGYFEPLGVGELQADWGELSGTLEAPTCELTKLVVFFEGPPADVDLYLDDVSLAAMP